MIKIRARLDNMARGADTRCSGFTTLLEQLGFEITPGKKGGHKVVTHPGIGLTPMDGANYDCGHNPRTHVKPCYIKKFARICDEYEDELKEWLK